MKIGILTYFTDPPYFNDINPGMNLQAYSVYMTLKKNYPDSKIEFIRYHSWFSLWRIYLNGITWKTFKQDIVQFWKYFKFSKSLPISKKALISRNPKKFIKFINSINYDAIYVGSDTILELHRVNADEITAYWLSNSIKVNKFMIAASARNVSFNHLTFVQKEKLKLSINSFNMLGVRDTATFQLIHNFVEKNDPRLKIIPDPTFNYDIDYLPVNNYIKNIGLLKSGKPIICFHLLKTSFFASELAERFRNDGFVIVSFRPAKYADFILKDLSPIEYAGIFKFFSLTFTHRFHDSIFSIKNLCPVVTFHPSSQYQNENGHSKHSSLMDSFGLLEDNFIQDISTLSIESLYTKITHAMHSFESKKLEIKIKLVDYKNEFEEYVAETVKITNSNTERK
jgi:hypothetical protein